MKVTVFLGRERVGMRQRYPIDDGSLRLVLFDLDLY